MNTHNLEQYRAAENRLWDHYGLTPTKHFVCLPKFNIKVRVLEVGQGEPLLFVHGSPNAAPKWAPLAAQLSDFRCLLLDRPGCGLSEPVDYTHLDLRAFGVDLLSLTLDGLDVPQASVVASSLGGALAFYFTQAHPERVVRLILEGCPAFIEGFHIPLYNLAWSVLGTLFGLNTSSQAAFRHLGHAASIDQGCFEMEVLRWRDALLKYTATIQHENQLNRNIASRASAYRCGPEFLRQIRPATLYLWGESDPFGGIEVGARSATAQPNAILRSFTAAGHLPWLDNPAAHANVIRAFLRDEKV